MTTFEFRHVKNGLIVVVKHLGEVEEVVHEVNPYATEEEEVEAFATFLRCVADMYGPSTSRYSKARIYIEVKPGDKYEDICD